MKNRSLGVRNIEKMFIIFALLIIAGCEEFPELQSPSNLSQNDSETIKNGNEALIQYTNHLANQAKEQVNTFDQEVALYSKFDSVCFMFYCKEDCMAEHTEFDDIETRTDFCYNDCGSMNAFSKYAEKYPQCKKKITRNASEINRIEGMSQ